MNSKTIYYINRYDLRKIENVKNHSGYEQIVKYDNNFKRIKSNKLLSNLLFFLIKKNTPKHYIKLNLGKELIVLFKALITGNPVFYLYADKDAFLLPLVKRKFNLKRLKVYGTLHWPIEISQEFSFYNNNLASAFNGIIGLSSSILSLKYNNIKIIPHGIDLNYWKRNTSVKKQNLYLIIGISNRNHKKQIEIINKIKELDVKASFLLIAKNREIQKSYVNIKDLDVISDYIQDDDLRLLYNKAKAVILFQDYCLASNVVLESIATETSLITNKVGDVEEYLGADYPLYIDSISEEDLLNKICFSEKFRLEVSNYLFDIKKDFDWISIAKETASFIQ
ncbi:glycosyltransferase family 1 protein [Psychroserpens jangbogonensis]|uniref:glycosyltransferase family 1 protein n=1 Tax=Psychroserpens jangbogonensis TaxID=1484460 RepID=UPI00053D412D|nr:glycosyltransferase family 1 protein [Psychroserpens jangbogonensis]